jgi:hypothetical protein
MNCGLSNLDTLRKHLLATSLGAETKFDPVLRAIGLAVNGMFETFCNRKFAWSTEAQITFTADREHFVLPRYPIAEVASVSLRETNAEEWEVLADEPLLTDEASGIIRFNSKLGNERALVKVVWSGGYWFETKEPDEPDFPSEMPAGATALEDDIRGAFLLQCEQVWQTHDADGTTIIGTGAGQFLNTKLSTLDLVPLVKQMLQGKIRYALA